MIRDKKIQTTGEYVTSKIMKVESPEIDEENARIFTELRRQVIVDSILHSKTNLEYYDKFMERVKDEKYFDLQHVLDIGLDFDILIFLSKKGIGKSHYMIKHCNEIVDAGDDVAIMRVLEEDVKLGLHRQLVDYDAHFTLDSKGFLYHKWQTVPDEKNPNKQVPRKCGVALALMTCLKYKGGGFPKTKLLVFDEASDKRKGVTVKHYEDFIVSVANSIEREKNVDKTSMPWIVYGNTDFDSAHPLFEAFQIDPDENLVYVTRQPEGSSRACKILYINSRGLYKSGASNSVFIGSIGNIHRAVSSFVNESCNKTNKVVSLDLTVLGEPYVCIIFTHLQELYHVRVAQWKREREDGEYEMWYFVAVGPFNPVYTYGYRCETGEIVTASLYSQLIPRAVDQEELKDLWWDVADIVAGKTTFFVGWDSASILELQFKKYVYDEDMYF